jgi:cytochrome P450
MVKLLGKGNLQTVHGKEHARDRKILSPIFTPTNLKGYVPRVAKLAENTVASWKKASNTTGDILAYAEIRKYVLRVGLELVLGFDVTRTSPTEYDRVSHLFTELFAGFFTVPVDVPGSNYRRATRARDELRKTILQNLETLLAESPPSRAAAAASEENSQKEGEGPLRDGDGDSGGRTALELLMEAKDEDGNPVPK